MNQLGKCWQSREDLIEITKFSILSTVLTRNATFIWLLFFIPTYQVPVWGRVLATAEVGEGPCSVSEHRNFVVLVEQSKQGEKRVLAENNVTAARAVSSNVSKRPNGLFIMT